MGKRRRKRTKAKPFREPVPGELERDAESWSGLKVAAMCAGALCLLLVGILIWKNIYIAGAAGIMGSILWAVFKHFSRDL